MKLDDFTLRKHEDELKEVKKSLDLALKHGVDLEKQLDRFSVIKPADKRVPKWMGQKIPVKHKENVGTPILMLSDLHLDEVVDLYEMDGVNEYDREIAERRLERTIEFTVKALKSYIHNVSMDGLIVAMLGDIITGDILDELAQTNEAPVPETIRYWVPILAAALIYLADELGAVHVPCVDGNHDRTYKRIPSKRRAYSSNAWIIYNWIADLVRDDDRITFGITPSGEQVLPVYDLSFLLVHGDGFRSGGGIGGIYPSLLKYLLRKSQVASSTGGRIDHTLFGHWHQLNFGPYFTGNGSLKGYDEYAKGKGFSFERPQQALLVVSPGRGITMQMPIHAD